MADDLGYGDLSCYGNTYIYTPNLDRMAKEGIRFTDYHSNGAVCSPTRAALLSGRYQQRVGITGVVYTWLRDSLGMSQEVHTLAESFQEAGYATAIFGKWHLGYKTEFNPIHQGFDTFKGFVAGNVDYHSHLDNQLVFDWWENDSLKEDPGYTTDLITQYAVDYLHKKQDQPFFLYLPYAAPHDPYQGREDAPVRQTNQPLREVPKESLPGLYKEMVEVLDEGIGSLLSTLDALDLTRNTFIFFCSDNGANRNGSNYPYSGFKGGLYEGGHRVPAIAYWPGTIEGEQTFSQTAMSMDLFPTLLDIAKIQGPGISFDGLSLHPALLEDAILPERPIFWKYNKQKAYRQGDWKLLIKEEEVELYNLKADPKEENNLSSSQPDKLSTMLEVLESWERRSGRK